MRSISDLAMAHMPEPWALRLAHWRSQPEALVWQPAPVRQGDPALGRRLAAGLILFDGQLVETDDAHPWDLIPPTPGWAEALHGHGWLDDALAADHGPTWGRLSDWVWHWLERHEDNTGPAWRPDLVARRMVRWIACTIPLLRGQPAERSDALFRALGAHLRFLAGRWTQTHPGGERIEALAGLVYGTISLEGAGDRANRAIRDLAAEAEATIGDDGAIASRCPEELAKIVEHLGWIYVALRDFGVEAGPGHAMALRRAVPVLRALMTQAGTLPRFHGGGDAAAADVPALLERTPGPLAATPNPAMGFIRLRSGDGEAVIDAAATPTGPAALTAHSSALGVAFGYAGQPIIVSRGEATAFGEKAARLARRRASHSSIEVAGACPATLAASQRGEALTCPGTVRGQAHSNETSAWALCESTEFETEFGPLLERRLHLEAAGTVLWGEDTAVATRAETRARVSQRCEETGDPCALTLRFHLHPDIKATQTAQSRLIGLILPDGSRWSFRAEAEDLALAPTRYFDPTRPRPRPALQIVATSYLIDFWGRITWTLQKISDGN